MNVGFDSNRGTCLDPLNSYLPTYCVTLFLEGVKINNYRKPSKIVFSSTKN